MTHTEGWWGRGAPHNFCRMPFFIRIRRYWRFSKKFPPIFHGRTVSRTVSIFSRNVVLGDLFDLFESPGCGALGYFLVNFETLRKKNLLSADLEKGNAEWTRTIFFGYPWHIRSWCTIRTRDPFINGVIFGLPKFYAIFDPKLRFPWQPGTDSDVTNELPGVDLPILDTNMNTIRRRLRGVHRGEFHHCDHYTPIFNVKIF